MDEWGRRSARSPGCWPVGDRLRGYVLCRVRPQHLNTAACSSRRLYFTRLHLGQLLLKQLMLRSAKASRSFPGAVGEGFCGPGGSRCKFPSSYKFLKL